MNRREMLSNAFLAAPGLGLAAGIASLVGCSDGNAPVIPTEKKRDDPSLQREMELPPGIEIKEAPKKKKKK